MKKLNITKKQYDESKYFNKKYGSLKFVSESGKLYKTDKGVVIALESVDDEEKPDDTIEDPVDGDAADDANGEEEVTVKKGDLATALQGVIDTVKDIAAENDVVLPEEEKTDDDNEPGEDNGEDDAGDELEEIEFDENKKEEVCPTCGAVKKECGGIKEECGGMKEECGPGQTCESADKERRAKLVREALARRDRAKKIRESIERRRRARKVLESIRRRHAAKKVLESLRKRRMAKKILESARKRRLAKKVMESRRIRAQKAGMAK